MGQFAGYDFAFFWMMGGITAAPLFEPKINFINTVVVIIVIYLLHYLISYIAVKNRTFARFALGRAVPLISGGRLLRPNMARTFFPLELLLADLRTVDAPNLNEVEAAVLETSGHVSVLKKSAHQPVTPKDLNIKTLRGGLPVLLGARGRPSGRACARARGRGADAVDRVPPARRRRLPRAHGHRAGHPVAPRRPEHVAPARPGRGRDRGPGGAQP
jgi:uncharacterized membrane protein YcaP (DUF421 family)